jgi:hypothetical protein
VLPEQGVLSPGSGKVRLAGRVLLAGSCSSSMPKICTETRTEQANERNEDVFVVEELEMVEPRSEGDLSTGMEVENGGPGMLSVGTGEEHSRFVMENVLGELGNIGGVTKEPEEEKEEIFSKVSDPVIQPEPRVLSFSLEEGRELDVLGGRDFLLRALLESRRAQRSCPLLLSKLNPVLKLWRVE